MTNVCVDTRPYKSCSDKLLSGSDTRVTKAMKGIEKNASPREWN